MFLQEALAPDQKEFTSQDCALMFASPAPYIMIFISSWISIIHDTVALNEFLEASLICGLLALYSS